MYVSVSSSIHPLVDILVVSNLGYCEQCYSEQERAGIFKGMVSFPLDMCPEEGLLGHIVDLFLMFLKLQFTFLPTA